VLEKAKHGSGLPKLDRSVNHPNIRWKGRDESRRCFGANVGYYSLLVFRRNASSGTALMDIGGLVALLGVRLVADFLSRWPLPMVTRRFRWLLIGFILLYIITFCPFLLLLLHYLFFTPFSIGGRRVTSSWPRAALRAPWPNSSCTALKVAGSCLDLVLLWVEGSSVSRRTFTLTIWINKKDMEVRDELWKRCTTL
jgi:hypothetical protein